MRQRKNYAAVDVFRIAAALMIVAIHTGPLASFSETADFLVTYCLGRVGVPFFLMVSGFFVLAPYQKKERHAKENPPQRRPGGTKYGFAANIFTGSMGRFLKKTALLYVISTFLYLPLKIYSDNISDTVGGWLKEIFFDGTFYHLWYLPAVILGCLLIAGLLKFFSPLAVSVTVFVLYVLGVLGDSYYNLISQVPFVKTAYECLFAVSSYTRNGIFFAPMFLWMGVLLANGGIRISKKAAGIGLAVSLAGMLAEGFATFAFQWQKHNSMYFLLVPVMFFLFELLLLTECRGIKIARDLSMYIYILHPLCIVIVRGLAGAAKVEKLLVEQSLCHYAAVAAVTILLSLAVAGVKKLIENIRSAR